MKTKGEPKKHRWDEDFERRANANERDAKIVQRLYDEDDAAGEERARIARAAAKRRRLQEIERARVRAARAWQREERRIKRERVIAARRVRRAEIQARWALRVRAYNMRVRAHRLGVEPVYPSDIEALPDLDSDLFDSE
jgi:hypothetical protein